MDSENSAISQRFTAAAITITVLYFLIPIVLYCSMLGKVYCGQNIKTECQKVVKEDTEAPAADDHLEDCEGEANLSENPLAEPPKVLLSFMNVKYSVPSKPKPFYILKGVSAHFDPATLTAIMGPSGCGKTTLLDVLADQKEYGTIEGSILVNGQKKDQLFRKAAVYVMQFDNLFPDLTVRETLWFVSQLRLSRSIGNAKKIKIISKVLKELDLDHVADTRIGGTSGGGLSGGQKRRVTVAIELITNPGLIFLDEPTSGLDAYGSLKVMNVLKALAIRRRTVICTIHQPRADIFKLFDNLLLLKNGASMFFGSTTKILPYFESCGVEIDTSINPADFIVDLTHERTEDEIEQNEIGFDLDKLVEIYSQSDAKRAVDANLKSITKGTYFAQPKPLSELYSKKDRDAKYVTSFTQQSTTLLHRSIMNETRNAAYIGTWLLGGIMMLFFGTLYSSVFIPQTALEAGMQNEEESLNPDLDALGVCTQNVSTISFLLNRSEVETESMLVECGSDIVILERLLFARRSLLYQLLAAMYFSESPVVAAAYADRNMFLREHMSRSYSIAAWHFNWYVRLFFAGFLKGLLFSPLVYFPARLTLNFEAYALFSIFMGAMSIAGSSVALFVSSLIPSLETSVVVFVVINIVSQNLSGYFLPGRFIPPWFIWYYFINFFRYAFEGLVLSQLITSQKRNFADSAWFNAVIALIFAFAFQVFAITSTYFAQRGSSKALKIIEPEETNQNVELEKTPSNKRNEWLAMYRQMHRDSVRNYNLSTQRIA